MTEKETCEKLNAAREAYMSLASLDTFDLPADHATYKRKVAAHILYLRTQAAFNGTSAEPTIEYLYGKQTATPCPSMRKEGVIGRFGEDWAYIDWQGESLRFQSRHLLGYNAPLKRGLRVAFTMGEGLCAVEVTVIGDAQSEAAYAKVKASKDAALETERKDKERRERIRARRNGGRIS